MKGSHIIIAAGVTVVALVVMGAIKFLNIEALNSLTDSSKIEHTVNIGVDNWAGYYPLCSPETRRRALDNGVLVKCHDDGANMDERVRKLKAGELQMAAMTVDSYVRNGSGYDYPGSFLFVIDESQGGDAIVASKAAAPNGNIDDLRGKTGLRIAFTPDSPSEMLVTAWKQDFGIDIDGSGWTIVEANGSSDARQKLMRGEVDVAVLWQPDVAQVLANSNFVKLLGTEDTKNLIVDTLVGQNQYVLAHPDVVQIVARAYFEALEYYKTNGGEFNDGLARYSGISEEQAQSVRDGIDWVDLPRNGVEWMGVDHASVQGKHQLYDTVMSTTRIMINGGNLSINPLRGGDGFSIINSTPLAQTFQAGMAGELGVPFALPRVITDVSITRVFDKLSPGRWARLSEVGSVQVPPITFRRGTADLYPEDQEAFDALVDILTTYPRYRIKIVGHTGRGDRQANSVLSKRRANEVARHLTDSIGIDQNRIFTLGRGNDAPPVRNPGEPARAYYARWPRVELVLVQE